MPVTHADGNAIANLAAHEPIVVRSMKKIFGLTFIPLCPDLGLLAFRVVLSALVIRYHGCGKLTGWENEPLHLPNVFALDGVRKGFHTFPNYIGIS